MNIHRSVQSDPGVVVDNEMAIRYSQSPAAPESGIREISASENSLSGIELPSSVNPTDLSLPSPPNINEGLNTDGFPSTPHASGSSFSSGLEDDDCPFSQEQHETNSACDSSKTESSYSSHNSDLIIQDEKVIDLFRYSQRAVPSNCSDVTRTITEDFWSGIFADMRDELFAEQEDGLLSPQLSVDSESVSAEQSERALNQRFGALSGWDYASPFTEIELTIDNANRDLANRFTVEAQTMLSNVIEEVASRRRSRRVHDTLPDHNTLPSILSDPSNFLDEMSMLDAFEAFLPESIMEKIRGEVNRVLAWRKKTPTSVEELRGVIVLHVLAASYSASVSTITDPRNQEFFFQIGIKGERYADIWSPYAARRKRGKGWNIPPRGGVIDLRGAIP